MNNSDDDLPAAAIMTYCAIFCLPVIFLVLFSNLAFCSYLCTYCKTLNVHVPLFREFRKPNLTLK